MKPHEANKLIDTIKSLIDNKAPDVTPAGKLAAPPAAPEEAALGIRLSAPEIERLYQIFYKRIIDQARIDPVLVQLLMARPELEIEVEPRVVAVDGAKLGGRVARLMHAGYFAEPRATSTVRNELKRTGADPGGGGSLSDVLSGYVRDGFLVREGSGYVLAANVKISEKHLEAR